MHSLPQNRMSKWPSVKIGDQFSRLTVISSVIWKPDKSGQLKTYFTCRCDCGNEKDILLKNLRTGNTKSCGCRQKSGLIPRVKIISEEDKPLHKTWHGMRKRCQYSSDPSFLRYGGRGIKVCAEWEKDFFAFRDWARRNGYAIGLQIDRIDNDGDYEPSNCRWTTCRENCRNKSDNHLLTAWGETKTIVEWSEDARCLVSHFCFRQRIKTGYTPEEAMTLPIYKHR